MVKEISKGVRISRENEERFKLLDLNFSEWVGEQIEREFEPKFYDCIKERIKQKEEELIILKEYLKNNNPEPKNDYEIAFLKETKGILEKEPKYTNGRIRAYAYQFNKPILSESEFKALLEKY